MRAHDAARVPGMPGDLGDAQHRGIARDDAVGFGRIDLANQVLLECEPLGHGLDHQIAAADAFRERAAQRHAGTARLAQLLQMRVYPARHIAERLGIRYPDRDLESGLRKNLGDAVPHQAGTEHAHARRCMQGVVAHGCAAASRSSSTFPPLLSSTPVSSMHSMPEVSRSTCGCISAGS